MEIDKKRELAAKMDIKKLEIMVAQRIRHHVKLAQFLRTKSGPPLLWLPKSRLDATDKLLADQQTILQLWQVHHQIWNHHSSVIQCACTNITESFDEVLAEQPLIEATRPI